MTKSAFQNTGVSTKSLDNLKKLLILQLTLEMSRMFKYYQLNGQVFI